MMISDQGVLDRIRTNQIKFNFKQQKTQNLTVSQKLWCWIQNDFVSVEKCLKCKYMCNAFKYYNNKNKGG